MCGSERRSCFQARRHSTPQALAGRFFLAICVRARHIEEGHDILYGGVARMAEWGFEWTWSLMVVLGMGCEM